MKTSGNLYLNENEVYLRSKKGRFKKMIIKNNDNERIEKLESRVEY